MFTDLVQDLADANNIKIKNMLKDLNIAHGSFNNWKTRKTVPSGSIVAKIAQYFNVSTDYLLDLTDVPDKSYNMVKNDISDREQEILLLCRQLDEIDQAELKGYIKGILSADKYRVNPKENIG